MSLLKYIGNPIVSVDLPYRNPSLPSFKSGIFNLSLDDYKVQHKIPYIISSNVTNSSTSTSVTVNTPANNEGDLLLAFCCLYEQNGSWSSSGWTVNSQSAASEPRSAVLSKISSGSEPSSFTFNCTETGANDAIILCISGHSSYSVGSWVGGTKDPIVTVPDDSSNEKLLIFCNASLTPILMSDMDVLNILEWDIIRVSQDGSIIIKAIYRDTSNTSLQYTVNRNNGTNDNYVVVVLIT